MTALKPPEQPGAVKVRPHLYDLPLRVGTRASPLARAQTHVFLAVLQHFCPVLRSLDVFEEHPITTTGDRVHDRRLAEIGGKGLFAKEIHEALADGRVDFAVHSLKDLETVLPPGIVLACTLKREDARDALILGPGCGVPEPDDPFAALNPGCAVGTSSLRRQAQLLHRRPDLAVVPLRGNVGTRLERLRAGHCAAGVLALAGLKRLEISGPDIVPLNPDVMVPAAGQGIIGITVRADDADLRELLAAIEDREAAAVAAAERALLAALDGSCRTPIGGHAHMLPDRRLTLTGLVARADGSFMLQRQLEGLASEAARIGRELGLSLRADSPTDLFA
ncbi:MAG: hydroxymethylbilane synthase [Acetobacteraceae bacterium]